MDATIVKAALKAVAHRAFVLGQRIGLNVTPTHFYSPIPNIATLKRTTEWRERRSMVGVAGADIPSQLEFARACCQARFAERLAHIDIHAEACSSNGASGFGPVESNFLYCFLSTKRPRRVVQIGAGVATAVLLRACEDESISLDLKCIDPFPTDFVRHAASANRLSLMDCPAQTVADEHFVDLAAGDLLFVDSSHAVKPGSEVNRIILEILPRLHAGVYVHFHDVTFPYDYNPNLLEQDLFFAEESVLLHAFLAGNGRCMLRTSLSMLHHDAQDDLKSLLPGYQPAVHTNGLDPSVSAWSSIHDDPLARHFPSSAYLEITADP